MPAVDTLKLALTEPLPAPWWRFGIVWLTFGLPAAVVVASLFTAGIAWRYSDPVVVDPPVKVPIAATTDGAPRANALEPAQRARNHAATPRP